MRPRGSPRGISSSSWAFGSRLMGFNEAAGKSPRNRFAGLSEGRASHCFNEAAGKSPRNRLDLALLDGDRLLASMRPRGSPRGIFLRSRRQDRYSYRFNEAAGKSPRNRCRCGRRWHETPCFNEAAGKSPRNPRPTVAHQRQSLYASMRPRGSPRGIGPWSTTPTAHSNCFNEAAGKSPRNPTLYREEEKQWTRFNEAAGKSPRNLDR